MGQFHCAAGGWIASELPGSPLTAKQSFPAMSLTTNQVDVQYDDFSLKAAAKP